MNALSIEFMGPELVLMLAALWTAVMIAALLVAGVRRALAGRARLAVTLPDGSRTLP